MTRGVNFLQTFSPADSNPELLEHTLIGRKDLADRLEELVIESITSGNKHQRLIIGPRGTGKTHTLKVLQNRLINKENLKSKFEIAYLCEEEYGVATFLDWIIRILKSFIRWEPEKAGYLNEEIEKVKQYPSGEQEKAAVRILLNHIKDKTLLIIVENMGNIFDNNKGFGKIGQQKFRDLIQQFPLFTIIASNQALFEDINKEDMPFYNFFKITHLRKLTLEEAISFLKSIAEWEKEKQILKSNFLKFLDTPEGEGKIKAIFDLIGGNHRLLVTFYQFLKTDYINKLSEIFLKTMNDLIPFYQGMMDLLSSQQQKIIQYMCGERKPVNVKMIAENCFSTHNTISKQMFKLVRLKYVEFHPSGKETYYELAEPLLRIYNEIKDNRGGPIKLFIDFLGNLYTAQELKKKYMEYNIFAKNKGDKIAVYCYYDQFYLKEALKKYHPDEFEKCKIADFEKFEKDDKIVLYINELEKSNAYEEIIDFTSKFDKKNKYLHIKEAIAFERIGNIEMTIKTAKQLLKKDKNDIDALLLIADALQSKEKLGQSERYYKKILKLDGNNILALKGLGRNMLLLGEFNQSFDIFLQLNEIDKTDFESIYYLSNLYLIRKEYNKAYSQAKKCVDIFPDFYLGWRQMAIINEKIKNQDDALSCYLKALKLKEDDSISLLGLALIYSKKNNHREAIFYSNKYVKLNQEEVIGWILLGTHQAMSKQLIDAKNSFFKAVKIEENNDLAIEYLGEICLELNDFENAEIYLKKLIKLKPEFSSGWEKLGVVQKELKNIDNSIMCFKNAIKFDEKNCDALGYLGTIYRELKKYNVALNYFKKIIDYNSNHPEAWRQMGLTYQCMKKIEIAEECYLKAISLDRNNYDTYYLLGNLYYKKGNFEKAIVNFKKVTKFYENFPNIWVVLGKCNVNLLKTKEAEKYFKKGLNFQKDNIDILKGLAVLYFVENKLKLAYKYNNKALKKEPNDINSLNLKADILCSQNKVYDAIPIYKQVIKLDTQNYWAHAQLTEIFFVFNNPKEALYNFKCLLKTLKSLGKIENENDFISYTLETCCKESLINFSINEINTVFNEILKITENYKIQNLFLKSISEVIFTLLRTHNIIELNRFKLIENYLNEKFKNFDLLKTPLKFLNIGIRHLKKNEKNVLFEFTKEERAVFKKFVLDEIEQKTV